MNRSLLSIIIKFGVALIVFAWAIVRLATGYVPSSKIVKYGNITAEGNPVSFWITIGVMISISGIFFLLGCWSLVKHIRSK